MNGITILHGHAPEKLQTLSEECVNTVVTSQPYWGLRDCGIPPSVWPCVRSQSVVRCSNGDHLWGMSIPGSRTEAEYQEAEVKDGRNKRSVWTVATQPFPEAHFATFPEELIKPCILAGCPAGGTVLDPFGGSGTTALVARANGCKAILIELNPEYIEIAKRRLAQEHLEFA
jgi:DNA modification methylase